jgi:hypothetical protein
MPSTAGVNVAPAAIDKVISDDLAKWIPLVKWSGAKVD